MRGLQSNFDMSERSKRRTIAKTINQLGWKTCSTGCMEELAELQQQISKQIRGFGDRVGLLEEMADVCIAIEMLKKMYDISDQDLENAMTVKFVRQKDRVAGR